MPGAVGHRAVRTVKIMLFVPLGELEPVYKVERSRSRFTMFGAVRLRAVQVVSHELVVHSERIRAVIQGVYILNLCHVDNIEI